MIALNLDSELKLEDILFQAVGGSDYYCYNDVVCSKQPKYITFVVITDVKSLRKVSFCTLYGQMG